MEIPQPHWSFSGEFSHVLHNSVVLLVGSVGSVCCFQREAESASFLMGVAISITGGFSKYILDVHNCKSYWTASCWKQQEVLH